MYSDTEVNRMIRRKYLAIIQRCHNPKNSGYIKYGSKGIKVCYE